IMRHFGFRRNYQVAEYFNVTPQTLSGWIKAGEIPPKHMMKYTEEVLNVQAEKSPSFSKQQILNADPIAQADSSINTTQKFSWIRTKLILSQYRKTLLGIPFSVILLVTVYVFWIADPVYTSVSKVLPVSEDGSTSANGFSGVAAELGINIPLSIGGTVPWAEIYPEIVQSSDLLTTLLGRVYNTEKYGQRMLKEILFSENRLTMYPEQERFNRAITELRKMIKISKDRLSPVVTLEVEAFEPQFAAELSKNLIEESGQIQRQLKTNRVRQKRLFIEERITEVSGEMKKMEKELREFREFNRNLSTSPSLEMQVQEMGRELDLQSSLYVTLKTQYEKAKIDEVERDDMVQLIDGPNIPAKLTRPRRGLSVTLALFFGIFLSIFTIYFKEYLLEPDQN
ncbi:uncharacterized protein METZ01_LOCUS227143, partial [marine metagenome]